MAPSPARPLQHLSPPEVAAFLRAHQLSAFADSVQTHQLDGEMLADMDSKDLEALGVGTRLQRRHLLRVVSRAARLGDAAAGSGGAAVPQQQPAPAATVDPPHKTKPTTRSSSPSFLLLFLPACLAVLAAVIKDAGGGLPFVAPQRWSSLFPQQHRGGANGTTRRRRGGDAAHGSIFVSVPSYRDPECPRTVLDLFRKASIPSRVFVGIAQHIAVPPDAGLAWEDEQRATGRAPPDYVHYDGPLLEETGADQDCRAAFLRLLTDHDYDTDWGNNVRVLTLPARTATGPVTGRAHAERLYEDEEYFLYIDSHAGFAPDWDTKSVAMLHTCPSPKCVLTAYGGALDLRAKAKAKGAGQDGADARLALRGGQMSTFLGFDSFSPEGFVKIRSVDRLRRPASDAAQSQTRREEKKKDLDLDPGPGPGLVPSLFWSACFSFSRAALVRDVPFDPHAEYVFFGEEITYAARAFTHGWDMFVPGEMLAFQVWSRAHRRTFWEQLADRTLDVTLRIGLEDAGSGRVREGIFALRSGEDATEAARRFCERAQGNNDASFLQQCVRALLAEIRGCSSTEAEAGGAKKSRERRTRTGAAGGVYAICAPGDSMMHVPRDRAKGEREQRGYRRLRRLMLMPANIPAARNASREEQEDADVQLGCSHRGQRSLFLSKKPSLQQQEKCYSLGSVRSLAAYERYCGVRFESQVVDPHAVLGLTPEPRDEELVRKFGSKEHYKAALGKARAGLLAAAAAAAAARR